MNDIDQIQNALAFIDTEIIKLKGPGDVRTRVFCALSDVAMEHGKSIYVLIRQELYSSAHALVRVMFETGVRSLWISKIATEDELEKYIAKDEIEDLNMRAMTKVVDDYYKLGGVLIDTHKQVWGPANSFTHGGILQVRKRLEGGVIAAVWDEKSERHLCQLIGLILLLLYTETLKVMNPSDRVLQEDKIEELLQNVLAQADES